MRLRPVVALLVALAACASADEGTLDATLRRLVSRDEDERHAAELELDEQWPACEPSLVARIESALDPELRAGAARGVGLYACDVAGLDSAVSALRAALGSTSERVRREAALALSGFGERAAPALADLIRAATTDDGASAEALWALSELGPLAAGAVPDVLPLLASENDLTLGAAIEALGAIATEADAARVVPALALLLEDRMPARRTTAALALARFGRVAVAPLVAALERPPARDSALLGLRKLGAVAAGSGPRVHALLSELRDDPALRISACRTLHAVTGDVVTSVPTLAQLVTSQRAVTRAHALRALAEIGPNALEALPEAVAAVDDPERQVRLAAVETLGSMGARTPTVLDALRRRGSDEHRVVREAAARVLRVLGGG